MPLSGFFIDSYKNAVQIQHHLHIKIVNKDKGYVNVYGSRLY